MRLPRPADAYHAVRDQLGSIRTVYLSRSRISRRDDFDSGAEVVLLLHGFFQTRNIWDVMEDRLRHDGYTVMSFNLGGLGWHLNTRPIDELVRLVAAKIERLREKHGFDRLHIVGHSKGGLIARRYVQHGGGLYRTKSLITLGTPHHGAPTALVGLAIAAALPMRSSARDLLPGSPLIRRLNEDDFPAHIPLTSVYSTGDIVCPWWSSVLHPRAVETSMENDAVRGVGHSALAWDPGVYQIVQRRLAWASTWWREREQVAAGRKHA